MINRKIAKLFFPAVAGTVIGFSTILATAGMGWAVSTVINSPNNKAISNVVLYLQDTSGNIIKVKVDNFSDAPQETKTFNPSSVLQQYSSYELLAYTVKAGNNTSTMGPGEGQLVIVDSTVQQSQLPVGSATTTYQYTAVLSGSISSGNTVNTNTSSNTTTSTENTVNTSSNTTSTENTVNTSSNTTSTENTVNNSGTTTISTEGTVDTSSNTNSTESTVNTSSNTTSSTASTVDTNQTEPEVNTAETNSGDSTEVASNSVPTTQTEDVGNTANEPVVTNTFRQDNGTKPVSVPEPTTVGAIALFGLGGLLTKKKLTSASK